MAWLRSVKTGSQFLTHLKCGRLVFIEPPRHLRYWDSISLISSCSRGFALLNSIFWNVQPLHLKGQSHEILGWSKYLHGSVLKIKNDFPIFYDFASFAHCHWLRGNMSTKSLTAWTGCLLSHRLYLYTIGKLSYLIIF